jgi:hypothetical protein
MHTLFSAPHNDLYRFLLSLSMDEIRDCCTSAIYKRGEDYFDSGAILRLTFNKEKTLLRATVEGDEEYTVTLKLADGKVSGACTCPYAEVCKHIVATILYANDDESEVEFDLADDKDTARLFRQYLESLPKDGLVTLVEKFATGQFRAEIINSFANENVAQKTFRKVEQKIHKLFKNDDLMYSPDGFSDALDNELNQLSGLEKSLTKEIEGLIFFLIHKIDDAFDDGYLYDDYGDSSYYASSCFEAFVNRYISGLQSNEKTAFLSKLDKAMASLSYSTFERLLNVADSVFSQDDLTNLKNVLLADYQILSRELAGRYYDRTAHLLSFDEKCKILTRLKESNEKRAIELAALHDEQGDTAKAIETMKAWLKEDPKYHENAWTYYLDLLAKEKRDLPEAAAEAIVNCPRAAMLYKIVSLIADNHTHYEQLL